MNLINAIFLKFSGKERRMFLGSIAVLVIALVSLTYVVIRENGTFISIPGGSYAEGIVGQPVNLNPVLSTNSVDQEISSLLYAPLMSLLETWSVSPDGKTYTLEMKDGLKWSDGEALSSDDVIFTINTAQDPHSNSPFFQSWQGVSVERVSAIQVKLTIPNENVFFMDNVRNLPVIPEHIYGVIPIENFYLSEYKLNPVGSGPYEVQSFSQRKDGFITEYHLERNRNFSGDVPFIPDFYFKFFENKDDLAKALELHEANGYNSLWPPEFDTTIFKGSLTERMPSSDYYALFFNQSTNPVMKDAGLRTALTEGVDKNAIANQVFGDAISPIEGPVLLPGTATGTTLSYNPADASQIVGSFKSKNKLGSLTISISVPDVDFLKRTADIIKSEWQAIGIDNVEVKTVDVTNPVTSPLRTRDYDTLLFGNFLENEEDLFPFWHSSQETYPGLNLSSYGDTTADNLMEEIRQTSDDAGRQALLTKLQSVIVKDDPAIFLFSLPYFYVHPDELKGFNAESITSEADIFKDVNKWSIADVQVIK